MHQMKKEQIDFENDEVYILGKEKMEKQRTSSIIQYPKDPSFQSVNINILDWKSEKTITLQTHFFQLQVKTNNNQDTWQIQRRYSDFEWLFNALKFGYPGCVLPYFPIKTIQIYIVSKLNISIGEETKEEKLLLRKKQLQIFISGVCNHKQLKHSQQIKIFLLQNAEQFKKQKRTIQMQIKQSQAEESSSNGIVSIFQRGVAWMTSSKENIVDEKIQDIPDWEETEKDIKFWINQMTTLMTKIKDIIKIKEKQASWDGPQTQLDSVEHLKAKIVSGKQYNILLMQSLDENVLQNLQYDVKSLKQIENQLQERKSIINIILYIRKFTNDQNRSNKLVRKKQKFELTIKEQWPAYRDYLKIKMKETQMSFQKVWKNYSLQIRKIWKNNK